MARTAFVGLVAAAAGCGDGVHSASDAPFEIGAVRTALFAVGAEDEPDWQTAVVVLSSEDLACDALAGVGFAELLDRATETGTGALLSLTQWAPAEEAAPDWTGPFTADAAIPDGSPDESYGGRDLAFAAFSDGVLVEVWDEPVWAHLDRVDDRKVAGAFDGGWWWGSFRAEPCEPWDASWSSSSSTYTWSTTSW